MTPLELRSIVNEMIYGPWYVRLIRLIVVSFVVGTILSWAGAPLWVCIVIGSFIGWRAA